MPAKPVFNQEQLDILQATAKKVFAAQFKWMKADKAAGKMGGQEAMALALGITQQSVSALMTGRYKPGVKVARGIANLEGHTLEQLVGDFADPEPAPTAGATGHPNTFRGLETCVEFHASTRHWSPWTLASARAGIFGLVDFPAPEWTPKLDALEKVLEKARKTL